MTDLILDSELKMTTIQKAIAKITERRVKDIRVGEILDILPKATDLEIKAFRKAIRNDAKLETERHYEEIGSLLMMMIFRVIQREEENKTKGWVNQ